MKEALRRAARTALQTFVGTLSGTQVALDVSFARDLATAAIGALIAGLGAFAMNLDRGAVPADTADGPG